MSKSTLTLEELHRQLAEAQEREKRALADYQNIIRRNQDERARLVKSVAQEVVGRLIEPLHHLNLAAQQLNDPGLDLVVTQLWQKLTELGLKEIDVLGKPFDVTTMEVVDKKGSGNVVKEVMTPGYALNGEVIQHARVIVG